VELYRNRLLTALCLWVLLIPCILPSTARAQDAFPEESARLSHVMHAGNFEDVIAQTTEIMNRSGRQDATLTYLRGMAEWHLCWFGAAYNDLKPLGNFRPQPRWDVASDIVDKIERMHALAPANVAEVREGGAILFRVYYDEDTEWTKGIRKLLPQAFKLNSQLFGVKTYEIPVFIFKDWATYTKFSDIRFGKTSRTWAWASASDGILMFCRTDAKGRVRAEDPESDYFKATVVHEHAHAVLHRISSTTVIPSWLDEGIAVFAGSRISPKDVDRNELIMKRCFEQGTLLTFRDITDRATFYSIVEKEDAKKQTTGPDYSGTDAYQQAFNMVRYFLLKTREQDRVRLLRLSNERESIEQAFQEVFGISIEAFYNAWRTEAAKGLAQPEP
jgi:hypothetical protein